MTTTEKFNSLKELTNQVKPKWPGEKQAPEQRDAADFHNMAQLFARLSNISNAMADLAKAALERDRSANDRWLDVRKQNSDLNAKMDIILHNFARVSSFDFGAAANNQIAEITRRKNRMGGRKAVINLMSDGKERHVHSILTELKELDGEGWPEPSIYSICAKLVETSIFKRVRSGIYVLVQKEGA